MHESDGLTPRQLAMQIEKERERKARKKFLIWGSLILTAVLTLGSAFATWLFFMTTETVDPGEEIVLVDRPYFFDSFGEGVRAEPITEGRVLIFVTTSAYKVSVVPTTITVQLDDFATSDGFLLDFQSSIQFRINDSVSLIKNFGPDWFKNNIQAQYIGIVRNVIKENTMRNIMTDNKTADRLDNQITDAIRGHVEKFKLPIEVINITLGRAKPNDIVINQMNQTAAQSERANTLTKEKEAEEKRKETEQAKAQADDAYRKGMGLNPEQYNALQIARLFAEACEKSATCIVTPGNTNLALPIK